MKNKKLEFEKLKSKLKSLFFKKLLSIIPNSIDANLTEEKIEGQEESNTSTDSPKIEKQLKTVFIKNSPNSKLNITKIEKLTPQKNDFELLPQNEKISKINKIFKNSNNYEITNNIHKNIILNNKNINLEKKIIKNKNNYIFEDNKKQSNRSFEFYKNVQFKYIERPDQIKNLNFNNIENKNFEIDLKKITIPSKEQLMTIQKKLRLTPNKTKITNSKNYSNRSNIINNKKIYKNYSNKLFNLDYIINENNKTFEKQKLIYALPAFEEGTDGQPVKNDMIAKIHEKEIILNKNESKNYTENKFVKNENVKNLTQTNITNNNMQSDAPASTDNKINNLIGVAMDSSDPLSANFDTNKNVKESQKIDEMSANTSTPFDKSKLYIKDIEQPLFIVNQGLKQKSPIWRTSVG